MENRERFCGGLPALDNEECTDELRAIAFMVKACGNSICDLGAPTDESAYYAFDMLSLRIVEIAAYLESESGR